MNFKDVLDSDLDTLLDTDEFAQSIEYRYGTETPLNVNAQVFDEASDIGDSVMRIIIVRMSDIPTISTRLSSFLINGEVYGVISYTADEHNLLYTILTQRSMRNV